MKKRIIYYMKNIDRLLANADDSTDWDRLFYE